MSPEDPAAPRVPRPRDRRLTRSDETKSKLLDAAERLLVRNPLAAVSMREITAAAEVSLSVANYHFGSKDELFRAAFLRRARILNRERHDLLQRATAGGPASLRALLDALLRPGVRWSYDEGGRALFIQFLAAGLAEITSSSHDILHKDVLHLQRFLPHLRAALPDLDDIDIMWRMHFALGALHYTITGLPRLAALSDGRCDTNDFEQTLTRITDACEAIFRAPPSAQAAGPLTQTPSEGPNDD
ncbi:TetR/AcrR family transcriptional regulator [Pararhodobacter aggregans]|uniref:TetR/AcrR family transcriptional regulator n=1 Tax=Pararhodobacter aggregans TaxID=404875 RepID=A0A2T7USU3_9RHOB|nr:TetR/AcrR family transcriptional regulator [Pararhodobacter aggregans]PTX03353.1 TetR family transcriptional regulator [Pararhodobacter aggregans]PVE47651.1 TetR/AcrR family transcriptional regulator [Pararhodobacter aggregans]